MGVGDSLPRRNLPALAAGQGRQADHARRLLARLRSGRVTRRPLHHPPARARSSFQAIADSPRPA